MCVFFFLNHVQTSCLTVFDAALAGEEGLLPCYCQVGIEVQALPSASVHIWGLGRGSSFLLGELWLPPESLLILQVKAKG